MSRGHSLHFSKRESTMKKVAVFDAYVKKANGNTAHFDIIVPDGKYQPEEVIAFGRQYLESIQEDSRAISAKECRLCHIEEPSPEIMEAIARKGFYILEMEDIPERLPAAPSRTQLILHIRANSEQHRFANFRGWDEERLRKLLAEL